jgi:hypothetical protein
MRRNAETDTGFFQSVRFGERSGLARPHTTPRPPFFRSRSESRFLSRCLPIERVPIGWVVSYIFCSDERTVAQYRAALSSAPASAKIKTRHC